MTYEFQSTLFRTTKAMADAIAVEWLSGGGANNLEAQQDFLDTQTDADMADEAIEGWNLTGEWAEKRDFTRDDLIAAFFRLRQSMKTGGPKHEHFLRHPTQRRLGFVLEQ